MTIRNPNSIKVPITVESLGDPDTVVYTEQVRSSKGVDLSSQIGGKSAINTALSVFMSENGDDNNSGRSQELPVRTWDTAEGIATSGKQLLGIVVHDSSTIAVTSRLRVDLDVTAMNGGRLEAATPADGLTIRGTWNVSYLGYQGGTLDKIILGEDSYTSADRVNGQVTVEQGVTHSHTYFATGFLDGNLELKGTGEVHVYIANMLGTVTVDPRLTVHGYIDGKPYGYDFSSARGQFQSLTAHTITADELTVNDRINNARLAAALANRTIIDAPVVARTTVAAGEYLPARTPVTVADTPSGARLFKAASRLPSPLARTAIYDTDEVGANDVVDAYIAAGFDNGKPASGLYAIATSAGLSEGVLVEYDGTDKRFGLRLLDGSTGSLKAYNDPVIRFPAGAKPTAITGTTSRFYVYSQGQNKIRIYYRRDGTPTGKSIRLAAGNRNIIAMSTDGTYLYALDSTGIVFLYRTIDGATLDSGHFVLATANTKPSGIWYDPDKSEVWVADEAGFIYTYDINTGTHGAVRNISGDIAGKLRGIDVYVNDNYDPTVAGSVPTLLYAIDDAGGGKALAYQFASLGRSATHDITLSATGNDAPTDIFYDEENLYVLDGSFVLFDYDTTSKLPLSGGYSTSTFPANDVVDLAVAMRPLRNILYMFHVQKPPGSTTATTHLTRFHISDPRTQALKLTHQWVLTTAVVPDHIEVTYLPDIEQFALASYNKTDHLQGVDLYRVDDGDYVEADPTAHTVPAPVRSETKFWPRPILSNATESNLAIFGYGDSLVIIHPDDDGTLTVHRMAINAAGGLGARRSKHDQPAWTYSGTPAVVTNWAGTSDGIYFYLSGIAPTGTIDGQTSLAVFISMRLDDLTLTQSEAVTNPFGAGFTDPVGSFAFPAITTLATVHPFTGAPTAEQTVTSIEVVSPITTVPAKRYKTQFTPPVVATSLEPVGITLTPTNPGAPPHIAFDGDPISGYLGLVPGTLYYLDSYGDLSTKVTAGVVQPTQSILRALSATDGVVTLHDNDLFNDAVAGAVRELEKPDLKFRPVDSIAAGEDIDADRAVTVANVDGQATLFSARDQDADGSVISTVGSSVANISTYHPLRGGKIATSTVNDQVKLSYEGIVGAKRVINMLRGPWPNTAPLAANSLDTGHETIPIAGPLTYLAVIGDGVGDHSGIVVYSYADLISRVLIFNDGLYGSPYQGNLGTLFNATGAFDPTSNEYLVAGIIKDSDGSGYQHLVRLAWYHKDTTGIRINKDGLLHPGFADHILDGTTTDYRPSAPIHHSVGLVLSHGFAWVAVPLPNHADGKSQVGLHAFVRDKVQGWAWTYYTTVKLPYTATEWTLGRVGSHLAVIGVHSGGLFIAGWTPVAANGQILTPENFQVLPDIFGDTSNSGLGLPSVVYNDTANLLQIFSPKVVSGNETLRSAAVKGAGPGLSIANTIGWTSAAIKAGGYGRLSQHGETILLPADRAADTQFYVSAAGGEPVTVDSGTKLYKTLITGVGVLNYLD